MLGGLPDRSWRLCFPLCLPPVALWGFRLEDLSVDEMVGAWCFGCLSGPPGFTCWVSFALVVQFYLLLGHCLCFVSFLCLGLHVLGDGALVGWGSFMLLGICVSLSASGLGVGLVHR